MLRSLAVSVAVAVSLLSVACGNGGAGGDPAVVIRTPSLPPEGSPPVTGTQPTTEGTPGSTGSTTPSLPAATPVTTPGPDGSIIVTCGDLFAPLDKQHRLPADCVPAGLVEFPAEHSYGETQRLVSEAADALLELIGAAANEGVNLYLISSYRSYDRQVDTYNRHVIAYGEEYANRVSARPGHSEHQLGTTADVISASAGFVLENFPGTPEAAWVEANAVRFGFVVSYPDGLESVTGYAYEPWHIRYVGIDVAALVEGSGLTLGQYLQAIR